MNGTLPGMSLMLIQWLKIKTKKQQTFSTTGGSDSLRDSAACDTKSHTSKHD
jgi:hypothetical protein